MEGLIGTNSNQFLESAFTCFLVSIGIIGAAITAVVGGSNTKFRSESKLRLS